MPYKFETEKKKLPRELDRRIKLSEKDKIEIKSLLDSWVSQTKIANDYWVNRTTIYYIKYPERLIWAKEKYSLRRLDWRYYNKEKQTKAASNLRKHKQKNRDLLI